MEEEKKSKKGIVVLILLLIIVVFVVIGIFKEKKEETNVDINDVQGDTIYGDSSLNIDAEVDKQLRDYRNVIICGIDNMNRSDVIMIASINKNNNKVKIFNIYRDTYMQLKSGDPYYNTKGQSREFFKCNHAYKYGGKMAALKELNMNMDLNCREIIGMNWDTVEKFIDGVGGIDVDVTDDMLRWANERVNSGKTIPGSGYQHLNGGQAVGYLRTRYDATAVQRSERNEDVFLQIFEKINKMSKEQQVELFDSIVDDIDSNMSNTTMTEIMQQIAKYEVSAATDWPYNWRLYWDSYYYFVPLTLESNVVDLHKEVFDQEDYKVTKTCKDISDKIESNRDNYLVEGDENYGK